MSRLGRSAGVIAGLTAFALAFAFITQALASPKSGAEAPGEHRVGEHRVDQHRVDEETASIAELLEHAPVRHVRAAELLLEGTEACVDGREEHAVLGTPGGDAGELLLALATLEELTGRPFDEAELSEVFDGYVAGFGRFYMHTDDHALEALGRALRSDRSLAESLGDVTLPGHPGAEPFGRDWTEALVRHPPAVVRPELLEALVEPDHIGCGHLRLVTLHPEEYGVRQELTQSFLRVVFRALWQRPEVVDFEVLHGSHHEEAVINVRHEGPVHAYTNVPALPPTLGEHSLFVNHPEVAAFVREQNAVFLLEQLGPLAGGVTPAALEAALARRAEEQLEATLGHLAPDAPILDVTFDGATGEHVHVERVR